MKKYFLIGFELIILLSMPNKIYAANYCSLINKNPATDCSITNKGTFEDPSMSTIIKNKYPDYTTKINKYCSTYCRQTANTIFPSTIHPMAADQYDSILGGNHFRWDDISITTTKECQTVIDYDGWLHDYEESIKTLEENIAFYLGELHQRKTDKIIVKKEEEPASCREKVGVEYTKEGYIPPKSGCMEYNNKDACLNQGGKWTNGSDIGNVSSKWFCCWDGTGPDYCQDGSTPQNGKCPHPVYKYGNIHRFTRLSWENYPIFTEQHKEEYCDLKSKPYKDVTVDDVWYDNYLKSVNITNGMLTQLRACKNSGVSIGNSTTPTVSVTYTDPTKNYTPSGQRVVKYNGKKTSEKVTDYGSEKATGKTKIKKIKCTMPSLGNATLDNIKNACKTTYEDISSLAYKKIGRKMESTFEYKMPNGVYQYILKETGESVDSNSPKVTGTIKDNYRYIDVGYPNYPVHYTTQTGEYPIYLTYKNLGQNGYFTNCLPNKTGRYDCTYKVINRIKTCPQGECPDPDPEDPDGGGSNPPGGGGDGSPLGINIVYRPISLTDPFPGESGRGRTAGQNWTKDDINRYIKNNRGTSTNKVYNKTPLYSFTLDAKAIRSIRNYNKTVKEGYSDFNLTCSSKKNGKQCKSKFLKNITNYGVKVNANTCLNSTDFYGCAGKPNQDKIKCALNKDKKYVCANCATNPDSPLCKEGNK